MWVKYAKDKIFSEYSNRRLANEIIEAIKKARAAGKSNDEIVRAMTDVIQNQINRREYISNHLIAGAIDVALIAKNGSSALDERAFKESVKASIGRVPKREGNPPHLHFDFK